MPEFKFTATNPEGVIKTETVLADNAEEVRINLKKQGLSLINLQALPDAKVTSFDNILHRVSGDDKAQFLEYFASMLEAGLTVSEALQAFYEDIDKPLLRKFIKDAQQMIRNGENLSAAFEKYSDLFPAMYSGMVKVGEASGTLAESLKQLAEHLKKTNELKAKVKNAMIYPAIILTALGIILVVMVVFVIPQISKFFKSANLELPALTQALITVSDFVINYWYLVIIMVVGGVWGFKAALADPRFGKTINKIVFRLPIFGSLSRTMNVALLMRTFGALMASGVNILTALDVVKESMSSRVYIEILDVIKEDVSKGNNISDSMQKFPKYFSPFEIRVISISERTGEIAKGLKSVAEFYETRLFGLLSGLSAALEPMLLIVMGGMVVLVALAIITPLYQLLTGVDQFTGK